MVEHDVETASCPKKNTTLTLVYRDTREKDRDGILFSQDTAQEQKQQTIKTGDYTLYTAMKLSIYV